MMQLINTFQNANKTIQGLTATVMLGLYFISSYFLEKSYALSQFPVPYFEQQTSFDAVKMKEWYAFMLEQNTFNIYFQTQLIDFAFIATVILAGFTVWVFVANFHPSTSVFRRIGYKIALALPLAGGFDVLENLVSFFMIAHPTSFNELLIFPYSFFAVIKFACWTIALFWMVISLIALPFTIFLNKKKWAIVGILAIGLMTTGLAQSQQETEPTEQLLYVEADPLAYLNKGYSIHLGYENWGMRFDLTKVKVDFPESFEMAFYNTTAFDLISHINGIKVDYIGKRTNWTKGAFIGLDINYQILDLKHRASQQQMDLTALNIGVRAGYKFDIYKGFYITPWAAYWKNIAAKQTFEIDEDRINTNGFDWLVTFHLGYAVKF